MHSSAAQDLFEITEPSLYHTDRWGFFSLLTRGNSGRLQQRSYTLDLLPKIIQCAPRDKDCYISQGEFTKPNRRVVNLARVSLMFVDIDPPDATRLTPDQWSELCLMACQDNGVPAPSMIVYSGRGVHLKWLLERPVPRRALPRWSAAQTELVRRLSDIGADPKAKDASRVLRLERTVNSKTGERCHIVWMNEDRPGIPVRYDFDTLFEEVMPLSREEYAAQREKRLMKRQERILRLVANSGDTSSPLGALNGRRLAWDRLEDLRTLAAMRGGVTEGWRMDYLFFCCNFMVLSGAVPANQLYLEANALSQEFAPGWGWHKSELSTLHQKAKAFAAGDRIEFNGRSYPPLYTPTNHTLINRFEITTNEQQKLRTIIDSDEKRRRDAQRKRQARKEAGAVDRDAYLAKAAEKRSMAVELRAQGVSLRKIAMQMETSVSQVQRLLSATS